MKKYFNILGVFSFLYLFLMVPSLFAAEIEEGLQQALAAYSQAQNAVDRGQRLEGFQRAERLFQRLLGEVPGNADLYANLGTSALQAEHLGVAVLAFRQALRLDPDHARALQNLNHARTLLPSWVPSPSQAGLLDGFFFWHRLLSVAEREVIAAVAFLLACVGAAAAVLWKSTLARNLTFLPVLVWLGMVVSLVMQSQAPAARQGVVIANETIARAADSNNAPARFAQPLPGGTEVDILEERPHWIKVGLANGRNAWIRDTAIGWVGS